MLETYTNPTKFLTMTQKLPTYPTNLLLLAFPEYWQYIKYVMEVWRCWPNPVKPPQHIPNVQSARSAGIIVLELRV